MSDSLPIQVLVVDDHALFRRGVVELLRDEAGFQVVGEAGNVHQALEMARHYRPQVVLMDVHMPGGQGFTVIPTLAALGCRVLMLTISERNEDLMAALAAGAHGYLLKNTEPDDLARAIRRVAQGQAILAPEITGRVVQAAVRAARGEPQIALSRREREVLAALARGATTAEIAAALVISESTVKTHVRHLLEKLEANNRTEAVARAAELGLLS